MLFIEIIEIHLILDEKIGTAQYDVESGEIKITKNCTITKFNDNNYIKEKSFIERIKANQVENEEMKKSENQKFGQI